MMRHNRFSSAGSIPKTVIGVTAVVIIDVPLVESLFPFITAGQRSLTSS